MDYHGKFELWKNDKFFDEEIRQNLRNFDIDNEKKEIEDRFYQDLAFGTGGLCGVMGAGTNRMNRYTVGRAFPARWLLACGTTIWHGTKNQDLL